jgi:cyclic pyranopterin phosphate synthase
VRANGASAGQRVQQSSRHGRNGTVARLPMYEVHDGLIATWSLEVHVVDHCNLRCAGCCTLSPHLAPRAVSEAALERDLTAAARVLRPAVLKLTGGEPLLHPAIACLAAIARRSGVAREVSLTTNGLLLPGAPDELFEALDRLTISLYPSAPLPDAVLSAAEERCRRHGVRLTRKAMPQFQELDVPSAQDAAHARLVHDACWLRHRCHLLHEGRFYACTRPPHLAAAWSQPGLATADGVDLHGGGDVAAAVLAYLESSEPLGSCRLCAGTSGSWSDHRQLASSGTTKGSGFVPAAT